jgi:hypothetical protein
VPTGNNLVQPSTSFWSTALRRKAMVNTLSAEVQSRIDAHLDSVERQLQAAGAERSKRRGIVDDLETQILDMLAARNTYSPTLTDVDAVLAGLDPPSAYANSGSVPVEPREPAATFVVAEPRLCPAVKTGTRYLAVALMGFVLLVLYKSEYDARRASGAVVASRSILMKALVAGAVLALVVGLLFATASGWIATGRIRSSGGREYGLGLAVLEALVFPALIIWVAAFVLSGPGFLECFVAPALMTAALAALLRWSTGPKSHVIGRIDPNGTGKVPFTSN